MLTITGLRVEGRSNDVWHEIVRGVDLTLLRGEVLGVVGESGAGKSTLGLACLGFAKPGCRISDGSVVFDGIDLLSADEATRFSLRGTRIAYVAQSAAVAFNPAHRLIDQTIETAVTRKIASRAKAEEDARSLYKLLQLPDPPSIGARFPHQVSGGQLQRAMTAMAMSCRPDLIVFDEPTTALDVTTQVEVLIAVRNIVEQFNTAAIYITHDLAVVAQMADRIMILRDGVVVEEAGTSSILTKPREDYTRSLWAVRKLATTERPRGEILLDIRDVEAGYGSAVKVLDGVSVQIPRGRTVAIVGESGSGKSTLARVVAGLLPPRAGEVRFAGEVLPPSLAGRDKQILRRIQLIHQSADAALNPKQTVGEVIGRPLKFYHGLQRRDADRRTAEHLEQVELDARFIYRLSRELSGGQKQRICIARALAARPELVICDEITSALDQIVQEEILRLLIKLQHETDVAYLFITHDLATVKAIADEVVIMQGGKVIEQGPRSEVMSPPYPAYTSQLLAAAPQMDPGWLTGIMGRRKEDAGK